MPPCKSFDDELSQVEGQLKSLPCVPHVNCMRRQLVHLVFEKTPFRTLTVKFRWPPDSSEQEDDDTHLGGIVVEVSSSSLHADLCSQWQLQWQDLMQDKHRPADIAPLLQRVSSLIDSNKLLVCWDELRKVKKALDESVSCCSNLWQVIHTP